MAEYSKDEAVAFLEATRRMLGERVGFKWLVEKLKGLSDYIESLAIENECLNDYLDDRNARADYESYLAENPGIGAHGDSRGND